MTRSPIRRGLDQTLPAVQVPLLAVYRFLATPRWLGLAALMLAMSAAMVALGFWQLDRYHVRSAANDRVDATAKAAPRPVQDVLSPPTGGAGSAGQAPGESLAWTRVTATGRYDTTHEILARGRTNDEGNVGFEIITPLVLPDGTALLVDRGWVPPAQGGARAIPQVPPAPTGEVTVVGRVHLPESRAGTPSRYEGRLAVRRIAPAQLARSLPYPVYGGYVTVDSQTPPADPLFTTIAPDRQNAWQNAGYTGQWWLMAGLTLVGYVYLARKEAQRIAGEDNALRDLAAGERVPDAPMSPGG